MGRERKREREREGGKERERQRKWNEFCYHEKACNKRKTIVIIIKKTILIETVHLLLG